MGARKGGSDVIISQKQKRSFLNIKSKIKIESLLLTPMQSFPKEQIISMKVN